MNACIPDTSYFATPEFLSIVLHIMGLIEIPLHLFGAWIILFRTPTAMSSVMWPMLNLHFWSSFLDVSISLLTIPFVLFPAVAGFPLGLLKEFGVSTAFQVHFVVTLIGLVSVSFLTVYSSRYYAIMGSQAPIFRKSIKNGILALAYFTISTFMIPFSMMIPDQKNAVEAVFQRLPCLPAQIYMAPVFVYTLDFGPALITVASLFLVTFFFTTLFTSLTVLHLLAQSQNAKFSRKTLSLQKKFLAALTVQSSIPIVVGVLPVGYMALVVPQGYYNQALNNFAFIAISFHGLLSTTSLLLIYQPYRQATLNALLPRWARWTSQCNANATMIAMKA